MYYCRCDDTTSRLSGVAYRTSKDLVAWSEPSMALVLPPSMSPPTFNRCMREKQKRSRHALAAHAHRSVLVTHSSSAAPASRRSCLLAAAPSTCQYAPPAWSTTGRGCLQVRCWLGLGCSVVWRARCSRCLGGDCCFVRCLSSFCAVCRRRPACV